MGAGTEYDGVVPSQALGQRRDRVFDEVPRHRGATGPADHGVLAAGPVHTGDAVALFVEQGGESSPDASGGADLEDAAGIGVLVVMVLRSTLRRQGASETVRRNCTGASLALR